RRAVLDPPTPAPESGRRVLAGLRLHRRPGRGADPARALPGEPPAEGGPLRRARAVLARGAGRTPRRARGTGCPAARLHLGGRPPPRPGLERRRAAFPPSLDPPPRPPAGPARRPGPDRPARSQAGRPAREPGPLVGTRPARRPPRRRPADRTSGPPGHRGGP